MKPILNQHFPRFVKPELTYEEKKLLLMSAFHDLQIALIHGKDDAEGRLLIDDSVAAAVSKLSQV